MGGQGVVPGFYKSLKSLIIILSKVETSNEPENKVLRFKLETRLNSKTKEWVGLGAVLRYFKSLRRRRLRK